jgi:hypothetical protein
MIAERERPHPGLAHRHGGRLHDPADDNAIGEHVEIVIVPLTGWSSRRSALEDQVSI